MADECGMVMRVEGKRALVETDPQSFCHDCSEKGSCGMAPEGKKRQLWLQNNLNAVEGDVVEFHIDEKLVVFSSLLMYLFPVAMLIAGIIVGGRILPLDDRDLAAVIGGIAGLGPAFIVVSLISRYMKNRKFSMPHMERIVKGE